LNGPLVTTRANRRRGPDYRSRAAYQRAGYLCAACLTPLLNQGPAFANEEREALGLDGLLPSAVVTMEAQLDRADAEYNEQPSDLAKDVFLSELQDRNEFRQVRDARRARPPAVRAKRRNPAGRGAQ
jgi:hypothetical protein